MYCVDVEERLPSARSLQSASLQLRTCLVKFARSSSTYPPGILFYRGLFYPGRPTIKFQPGHVTVPSFADVLPDFEG